MTQTIHYIPSMQAQYEEGVRHCIKDGLKPKKGELTQEQTSSLALHCGQVPVYHTGPMVEQFLECPVCGLAFGTWGMNPDFAVQHWNGSLKEIQRLTELIQKYPGEDTHLLQARVDKLSASRRQEYQQE